MRNISISRRNFLSTAAAIGTGLGLRPASAVETVETDAPFAFEVIRSEAEWQDLLTEMEFFVLRKNGTEKPKSSPLWNETRDGLYCCQGCALTLFDAHWKVILDMGWVFFRQSEPLGILTAIDKTSYADLLAGGETTMAPDLTEQELKDLDVLAGVEAKCRRCGSHLGHLISAQNTVLYCINGTALDFRPAEA